MEFFAPAVREWQPKILTVNNDFIWLITIAVSPETCQLQVSLKEKLQL